jgi:hypothetical protein
VSTIVGLQARATATFLHRPSLDVSSASRTTSNACQPSITVNKTKKPVRYFTIRELARLQGSPDDYIFDPVWSRAIQGIGNACPPPMVTPWIKALTSAHPPSALSALTSAHPPSALNPQSKDEGVTIAPT